MDRPRVVIVQHPQEPNDNEPGKYGRIVEFGGRSDGGSAYMAHSDRVGQGVLLLHEWFGLQDSFKRLADRLCDDGFTVLVPDLYDGAVAETVEQAGALSNGLDETRTMRRIKAAASFLVDNWHPRLGVIGFSLGASWASRLAHDFPVEATVLYYGTGPADPARWNGPVLGHFAEADDFEPAEDVRAFVGALEDGGVDVDLYFYEGTGHWFANAAVADAYDPDAAELALQRTVEFFHHHLA
jgi:carboxymethylenebutenolidase